MRIRERWLSPVQRVGLVIEPTSRDTELVACLAEHRPMLQDKLLTHGALLFHGFAVRDVGDFDRAIGEVSDQRLSYTYRSTPRTVVANGIYTATEYPADQEIPLHAENAYQREWPLKIALCCLTPAASGGETPLASLRRVTASIGPRLVDKFERERVMYVRHFWPFVDVPWQTVFQTEHRDDVERFCAAHDIACTWIDEGLRTAQVSQGTATHPATGERVFFNQSHLFHVSSLGADGAAAMIEMYGRDRLPRQSYYGDGQAIPSDDLAAIRSAFQQEAFTFHWHRGDVLLLDNMQFAHGRRPYQGTRRVVAALLEPHAGDMVPSAR